MNIITKQVEIERTINNDEIEKSLQIHGDLIRWAVVKAIQDKFIVEGVFLQK